MWRSLEVVEWNFYRKGCTSWCSKPSSCSQVLWSFSQHEVALIPFSFNMAGLHNSLLMDRIWQKLWVFQGWVTKDNTAWPSSLLKWLCLEPGCHAGRKPKPQGKPRVSAPVSSPSSGPSWQPARHLITWVKMPSGWPQPPPPPDYNCIKDPEWELHK